MNLDTMKLLRKYNLGFRIVCTVRAIRLLFAPLDVGLAILTNKNRDSGESNVHIKSIVGCSVSSKLHLSSRVQLKKTLCIY